jgi:hypothetical protein
MKAARVIGNKTLIGRCGCWAVALTREKDLHPPSRDKQRTHMNVSEGCWFPAYRPSCGSFAASVGSALCEPPWPGRTIWSSRASFGAGDRGRLWSEVRSLASLNYGKGLLVDFVDDGRGRWTIARNNMKALRGFLFCGATAAIVCAATTASAVTDFGHGKPITFQDLAGKTFCWYDGGRVTYGANGMETNHKNNHHTPWSVPEPGVLKYWGKKYTQVELLPDGRLHFYKYCLICGNHDIDTWATPCN